MVTQVQKKTFSFFIGALLAALGATNAMQNQILSLIVLLAGVYLIVNGLQ